MSLLQLAQDAGIPQFAVNQIAQGDEVITFEASDLEMLRMTVWNVYEDEPGQFQMMVEFQGHCLGEYQLQPLPADLSTLKDQHGYFRISGYILERAEDVEEDVAVALEKFACWTLENKGVSKPQGKPKLFIKASSDAIMQLVVRSQYNKHSKAYEIGFNGWAYEALNWAGDGIGGEKATKRLVDHSKRRVLPPAPVAPPAPVPTLNRR